MGDHQIRNSPSLLSAPSPTFAGYSSEKLGDIAARVVGELNLSNSDPFDDDFYASLHLNQQEETAGDEEDEDEESEFEFAVLCRDDDSSPISADEIFADGLIRPLFPIFNTDLVYGTNEDENDDVVRDPDLENAIRLPLRKLLTKERENSPASCSSSEADELDQIPSGTYCVWKPKEKKEKDMIGKKSRSTGSRSKRFRIRDLLNRSNSDGKDAFVFLVPSNHHHHQHHHRQQQQPNNGGAVDRKRREKLPAPAKRMEGKKSYLPYRKDLVGFFTNVNSISRTVRPF